MTTTPADPGPYVEDAPIPGVDEYIQNCFPTSGIIHRTMHFLVQTGYTSPFHHLAALLPAVANIMALRGWQGAGRGQQIALQAVLVGPSGSAKSTAIREVMKLVQDVEALYFGNGYREDKHNRWLPCEGTMPGILETLHDMHIESYDTPLVSYPLGTTPAVLYSEELPVSILSKQDALKVLLELFDPLPKVDRRLAKYRAMQKAGQKAPSIVLRPAISAVLATTPSTLAAVFQDHHLDGGLAQRTLWAFARGDITRLTIDVPDHTELRREVVGYWVQALRWHDKNVLTGMCGVERVLPLTPAVKELLKLTVEQTRAAHEKGNDRLVSVKVRGLNTIQLIAQVFAWSRGFYEVHPDDLDRALNFIQMCHESFQQVVAFLDVETDWGRQEALLRAIETSGGLSKSECYAVLRCSKSELDQALDALRDRGAVDFIKASGGGRGRPSERFIPKRAPVAAENGVVLPFAKPGIAEDESKT